MKNTIRLKKAAGFTLIELMIVVAIIGVLAVLAIYGVRKYIANSKTAEAKNALGQIGKDAQSALEKEMMAPSVMAPNSTAGLSRMLCNSASSPVPATVPSGAKYQPNPAPGNDYNADCATPGKGFCCLKFEITNPQYYSYNYQKVGATNSIGTGMTATANGNLNGDSVNSTFQLYGSINNGLLLLAPNIYENFPEE